MHAPRVKCPAGMSHCTTCGKIKKLDQFYASHKRRCKKCYRARQHKYYADMPGEQYEAHLKRIRVYIKALPKSVTDMYIAHCRDRRHQRAAHSKAYAAHLARRRFKAYYGNDRKAIAKAMNRWKVKWAAKNQKLQQRDADSAVSPNP